VEGGGDCGRDCSIEGLGLGTAGVVVMVVMVVVESVKGWEVLRWEESC
jgi:hypothetical protein